MSTIGVLRPLLYLASLAGDKQSAAAADAWKALLFQGDIEIDIGEVLESVYGVRNQHAFGTDSNFVFASAPFLAQLTGGLAGAFASTMRRQAPITGLSGSLDMCFGNTTKATYGGPFTEFHRVKRHFTKVSNHAPPATWQAVFKPTASGDIPDDPTAKDIHTSDKSTAESISKVSTLLYFVTIGSEFAMRFAFIKRTEGNDEKVKAAGYMLAGINTFLVRRLIALTSTMELFEGFKAVCKGLWADIQDEFKKNVESIKKNPAVFLAAGIVLLGALAYFMVLLVLGAKP